MMAHVAHLEFLIIRKESGPNQYTILSSINTTTDNKKPDPPLHTSYFIAKRVKLYKVTALK